MPDTAHLLAFTLAALTLAAIPGPGMLYVLARSLGGGRDVGLRSSFGTALGGCVHVVAAAAGISALVAASATAFTVVKLLGAAYLIWLGVRTLLSATAPPPTVDRTSTTDAGAFRQGVLTEALNPKTALFFVTFLPQFLSTGAGSPRTEALLLSAIFAGLYLAWFGLYTAAVDRLGRWLRRPRVQARIEQVTGVLLLTVAVRLATATA
jgi:threonine/homoserine/homoserine lactone efflux protein